MKFGIPAAMAFAMLAGASAANAQKAAVRKPVQVGAALGGAIPLSDLGKRFSTGYNFTGTIRLNPAGMPVGFSFDGAYNQFGAKGATNVNAKIAGVSGNVVLSMPAAEITPYLIGGVGYYHESATAAGSGSVASNHFGFNAGGGLEIPVSEFTAFIEARYNRISDNSGSTSFAPVTVGVIF